MKSRKRKQLARAERKRFDVDNPRQLLKVGNKLRCRKPLTRQRLVVDSIAQYRALLASVRAQLNEAFKQRAVQHPPNIRREGGTIMVDVSLPVPPMKWITIEGTVKV